MDRRAGGFSCLTREARKPCADRLSHRDVRHHAWAKESLFPREGAIDKLVHHHELTGRILLLQSPTRRDGENISTAEPLQRINIGAVRNRARREPVAFAMTGKEDKLDIADTAFD